MDLGPWTAFGRSEALVTSDHAPVYASYNLHMPPLSKLGEALYQALPLPLPLPLPLALPLPLPLPYPYPYP